MKSFAPIQLKRTWEVVMVLSILIELVGFGILSRSWARSSATRWLVVTGASTLYPTLYLRCYLPRNVQRASDEISSRLEGGAWLTLLGGMLITRVLGFLTSNRGLDLLAWLPAIVYVMAVTSDTLGGNLARLEGHDTQLGEQLEGDIDTSGVLRAVLLAISEGSLPLWFRPNGSARYLFNLSPGFFNRHSRDTAQLALSRSRRPIMRLTVG